jgi:AcrR family transcriptional regulator
VSPRPRKASDAQIFAAAHRIMSRLGPAQWTLADIAAEAGLTAGALVQRFGSKRGLLVAFSAEAASGTGAMFTQLRAEYGSPLATIRAYGDCMAQMAESPGMLAHHLGYLQLDMTDPLLHEQVRAQAQATRAELRALVDDAVASGELAEGADADAVARLVEVTVSGSLMTWGLYQEGNAVSWVRHDVDAVLAPYLRAPRATPRTSR